MNNIKLFNLSTVILYFLTQNPCLSSAWNIVNVKYQCNHPGCSSSTTVVASTLQDCKVACLNNAGCRTFTFDPNSNECGLFPDIPGENCKQLSQGSIATTTTQSTTALTSTTTTAVTTVTTTTLTTTVSYPLSGITVAGYGNGTAGSANNALVYPWGLAIRQNDTLYVGDYNNARVMRYQAGSLIGTIVAGTTYGSNANQLKRAAEISVDGNSNIYVADDGNYRAMLWRNNASTGVMVVGNGISGSTTSQIGSSVGLAVDSQGNIYVSDYSNHRVMKWTPNGTFGTVVAGMTGVAGSSNQQLNRPYGLYLDEANSYLYIGDLLNHRVQRYSTNITNGTGTTVAGGNGAGSADNQFNGPYGMCVSKKTNAIYIADVNNNRIQRWSTGATSGVTIAGLTGVIGTNATLLNAPSNVALNLNETYLYVSDMNNHRVQRYQLP